MKQLSDYQIVLYQQVDGAWVAEVPAIAGCHALMDTQAAALAELEKVFDLFKDLYAEQGKALPADVKLEPVRA